MNDSLSLSDWLNQQPLDSEIRFNEDQSRYLPIEFVKPKLSYLDPNWSTQNFNHQFIPYGDGKLICSGSVELIIDWIERLDNPVKNTLSAGVSVYQKNKRIITGSATFFVEKYVPNMNFGATCLSLCIVNAAKELGPFFGQDLNKDILTIPTDYGKKQNDKLMNTLKKYGSK